MGTSDPLQQKYLDISPYAYCAGDPVNLVDVDGRDVILHGLLADKALRLLNHQLGKNVTLSINDNGVLSYYISSPKISRKAQRIW